MGPRASTLPVWLLVLTVIYVALISLPGPPKSYGTGLDACRALGLNLAYTRGDSPRCPFLKVSLTLLRLPNWIEITPTTHDPQLLFNICPTFGQFRTMAVRAWFQKADRIDAFFGKQVDDRGIYGIVPVANQWLDVYLNVSQSVFWEDEHGTMLRAALPAAPDVEFSASAEALQAPGKTL
jgi:hypothetical protein